ncbi:AAA family ATPase [Clostridioides difficile]|uniref:ATP-dependent nuclease n=1 Tax=Clostridioides difficile TaxID=1496 RepID=UPI001C140695|nr:AAA family ATPase [Clostridioides difficile]HBF6274482.1 AAA family ATPase [Clostridioides difficile]HBY3544814.1 AAA family ATPase [Clostridioides difficile]HBY3547534.1 AAA family ATPase [Clostridioides difficile]
MKLCKLIVKNFRGLKGDKNIIDFENSNIIFLIGQNDVGKSSFLKAYEFFTNPKQKAERSDFYNYDQSNSIEIIGEFEKEENDDDNTDFSREPDWIDKWVNPDTNRIIIKKIWTDIDKLFKKYTYKPSESTFVENGFGGLETLFTKYAPEAIFISALETPESFEKKVNDIIDKEYLKKIEELFGDEYSDAVDKISELQKRITDADEILKYNNNISDRFKRIFPGMTLKIEQKDEDGIDIVKAFKTNHSVNVIKDGIDRVENVSKHGHGIIRQALFNFITFLKRDVSSNRKQYLILFEEPELFMHPKASRAFRKELYDVVEDSPFQILCATHSPLMVDISKPHSSLVRIIKNFNEHTTTYQVGHSIFQSEENKDFVQMINRFNPYVCEAFYAEEVILVEGDTEAIVFRYLIDKYYSDKDIYVLNTGSKNNMIFYQSILTHFSIKHHVVHDMDSEYNNNGKLNSAWTLNSRIEEQIKRSNGERYNGIAKRYTHNKNFEDAHPGYTLNKSKGKPLSAFEYAKTLTLESDATCINILKQIVNSDLKVYKVLSI